MRYNQNTWSKLGFEPIVGIIPLDHMATRTMLLKLLQGKKVRMQSKVVEHSVLFRQFSSNRCQISLKYLRTEPEKKNTVHNIIRYQ